MFNLTYKDVYKLQQKPSVSAVYTQPVADLSGDAPYCIAVKK